MFKPQGIVLLGPPCCGKGSLAESLLDFVDGAHHISTGGLIRNYLDDFSSNYRSDDVIEKLLFDELERVSVDLYFLDGVPRTLSQVSLVDELFDVRKVFYFDNLSNETLFNRMNLRGRGEDFSKRIDDFTIKSACLKSFYSSSRPNLYVSLDGNMSIFDNTLRVLSYLD
jgi:adenylate kinase family enzyme